MLQRVEVPKSVAASAKYVATVAGMNASEVMAKELEWLNATYTLEDLVAIVRGELSKPGLLAPSFTGRSPAKEA